MFYDFSFAIPANITKQAPEELEVYLPPGIIHRIEVGFPKGCAGLVHNIMRHGLNQLWPTNADGDFNADDYVIVINEHHIIDTEPFILTLVGWSFDDTFPHTLELRFGVLPTEVLMPEQTFIQAFKKLLKRLRL